MSRKQKEKVHRRVHLYTVCVTINFRGVWGSGPCIRQGDLLYVITHEEHIDAGLQEIKSNENTGENSC